MNIRLAPRALDDLARLQNFLDEVSPTAAKRMIRTVLDAVETLGEFPERGTPVWASGLRELIVPFGRAAYLLRYDHVAKADEIVIVRIRHSLEQR